MSAEQETQVGNKIKQETWWNPQIHAKQLFDSLVEKGYAYIQTTAQAIGEDPEDVATVARFHIFSISNDVKWNEKASTPDKDIFNVVGQSVRFGTWEEGANWTRGYNPPSDFEANDIGNPGNVLDDILRYGPYNDTTLEDTHTIDGKVYTTDHSTRDVRVLSDIENDSPFVAGCVDLWKRLEFYHAMKDSDGKPVPLNLESLMKIREQYIEAGQDKRYGIKIIDQAIRTASAQQLVNVLSSAAIEASAN